MPRLRPDFASRRHTYGDPRTAERVLAHYLVERRLSDRLRSAPPESRSTVYGEVYHELFAALPDHPQHRAATADRQRIDAQLRRLGGHLRPGATFLEIGCGDAALATAAAPHVGIAYGLDVTDALIDFAAAPANFRFLRTPGVAIPLPDGSVDFAYSNQLMEHLHPDDAADQLAEVYRVLKPGGCYLCVTPSRVSGPHDISCYFDYQATGLHLREYDYGALRRLCRRAGFRRLACSAVVRGRDIRLPYPALRAAEMALLLLPARLRAAVTGAAPVQAILGLNVVAAK